MSIVERNYDHDVSLPTMKTVADANEIVASFFVNLRLNLDFAGIMEYHTDDPLYAAIMVAEDSIRGTLGGML